jgi:hypothetical protein
MSALDWAAHIVEENGRELAESFLSATRNVIGGQPRLS